MTLVPAFVLCSDGHIAITTADIQVVSRSTFPHRSLSVQFDECLYCGADWYGSVGTSVFFPILYTFLLTNLLVIPLVSFIMYTTVIMLLFYALFSSSIDYCDRSKVADRIVELLCPLGEQLPQASFDGIWLYGTDVLGIYLFLFIRILFEYMQSEFDS